mgnify:CR=1 FL=1
MGIFEKLFGLFFSTPAAEVRDVEELRAEFADQYARFQALIACNRTALEKMAEIEEALRRIQKGTYGVCELTGKMIPRARLDAIPWTRFTVEAQSQLEREGALRQKRLGSLGTVNSAGAIEVDDDDDSDDHKPAKEKE